MRTYDMHVYVSETPTGLALFVRRSPCRYVFRYLENTVRSEGKKSRVEGPCPLAGNSTALNRDKSIGLTDNR